MRLRTGVTILFAAFCLAALAPAARADYDPLASGATKLTLDRGFLELLKRNQVTLAAVAPAQLKGATVTFPVSAGKFDPVADKGSAEHEGALVFRGARGSIPLKALMVKTTQRHAPLSAKLGGGQLKLASARSIKTSRRGFGVEIEVTRLALSAKVAGRLGKKLHLPSVFVQGQSLGSSTTTAQPLTVTLLGRGKTELTLDPGIVAKLQSLFVAVNPIFPAEHLGAPFSLPIFGGKVAPDGSSDRIETSGALELLQLGGGQVFLREPWLDLTAGALSAELDVQPSPPYPGKTGRQPIAAFAPTAVFANGKARSISVKGTLNLQASTAAIFNEVFARPQGKDGVFVAGEALGSVSLVAQGQ